MSFSYGAESKHNFSWYALCVRPSFESSVSRVLGNKGYEQFWPSYPSTRQWSDRIKQIHLPLFPGYLFCRLNIQERLLPVLTTPGVISILGVGPTPTPIPETEITAIQAVARSGLSAQPVPYLAAGAKVLIDQGPLKSLEGIVLSAKYPNAEKQCRLVVSVTLLQRSIAVEIQPEWVRPLSAGRNLSDGESALQRRESESLPRKKAGQVSSSRQGTRQ